jgi:hypothetical protein
LTEHFDIGHYWSYSPEQLAKYIETNFLYAECLQVASVSDRVKLTDLIFRSK